MVFRNVYADATRAEAYAQLDFPGTYFLAFRDLGEIVAPARRRSAGDRLRLRRRPVDAVPASSRLRRRGRRHLGGHGPQGPRDRPGGRLPAHRAGRLRAASPREPRTSSSRRSPSTTSPRPRRSRTSCGLARLLAPAGRIVSLVSTPEIYTHEWASFSTRDFPENREAKSGDVVRIVMTDVPDRRPVEDVVCTGGDVPGALPRVGSRGRRDVPAARPARRAARLDERDPRGPLADRRARARLTARFARARPRRGPGATARSAAVRTAPRGTRRAQRHDRPPAEHDWLDGPATSTGDGSPDSGVGAGPGASDQYAWAKTTSRPFWPV